MALKRKVGLPFRPVQSRKTTEYAVDQSTREICAGGTTVASLVDKYCF